MLLNDGTRVNSGNRSIGANSDGARSAPNPYVVYPAAVVPAFPWLERSALEAFDVDCPYLSV